MTPEQELDAVVFETLRDPVLWFVLGLVIGASIVSVAS